MDDKTKEICYIIIKQFELIQGMFELIKTQDELRNSAYNLTEMRMTQLSDEIKNLADEV